MNLIPFILLNCPGLDDKLHGISPDNVYVSQSKMCDKHPLTLSLGEELEYYQ